MKTFKSFFESQGYIVSADKKVSSSGRLVPARHLKTNRKINDREKVDVDYQSREHNGDENGQENQYNNPNSPFNKKPQPGNSQNTFKQKKASKTVIMNPNPYGHPLNQDNDATSGATTTARKGSRRSGVVKMLNQEKGIMGFSEFFHEEFLSEKKKGEGYSEHELEHIGNQLKWGGHIHDFARDQDVKGNPVYMYQHGKDPDHTFSWTMLHYGVDEDTARRELRKTAGVPLKKIRSLERDIWANRHHVNDGRTLKAAHEGLFRKSRWTPVDPKTHKPLDEKLSSADDMGTWVKDFYKSKAPQFKGKSKKKRRQMAIAAKLAKDRMM